MTGVQTCALRLDRIASLALFLAMTIAGRVVRVVLAAVEVLLGVGVAWSGIAALADPIGAARGAVGAVTGVSDLGAVRRTVSSVDVTFWPVVGIAGGVLAVLLGVVVLVVQRSWPGPSRKYASTPADPGTGAHAPGATSTRSAAPVERDAITDWDDLSAGTDPTDGTGRVEGASSHDDAGAERGAP